MQYVFMLIASGIIIGLFYVLLPLVINVFKCQLKYGGWKSTKRIQYSILKKDVYPDCSGIKTAAWEAFKRYLEWVTPTFRDDLEKKVTEDTVFVTQVSGHSWRINFGEERGLEYAVTLKEDTNTRYLEVKSMPQYTPVISINIIALILIYYFDVHGFGCLIAEELSKLDTSLY
ncbi:MAG: hypothetical protein ACYC0V_17980 [Armatimonadota bacterium]